MISKNAVREFLSFHPAEWDWIKKAPIEEVKQDIKNNLGYEFKTKPRGHQAASFVVGTLNKNFLFFLDMGMGKSYIVLNLLSYFKQNDAIKKVLVLTPSVVGVYSWELEVKSHTFLSSSCLVGTKEDRIKAIKKDADVYLMNYSGLQVLMTKKVKVGKKGKLVPDLKKCSEFVKNFDAVIYDEIQYAKDHRSLVFSLCRKVSDSCEYRYGLTGTPFGRDCQDLWSQFYLVDGGETLGRTITMFREAFFDIKPLYWGGFDYKLKKGYEEKLHRRIKHRSIRYEEWEGPDLPEKVFNRVPLQLSSEAREHYKKVIEGVIESKGNKTEVGNAFVRLREICSGFLRFKDDDKQEHRIIFKENPKLDLTMELTTSTPDRCKVVIFNDFIPSGDMIEHRLKSMGIGYRRLYSGTKDKDRKGLVEEFTNDDSIKVFLANVASGSSILNLQRANYEIFFESPVGCINRAQAEKRLHRDGQKEKTVFIYDPVTVGTVEEKILRYHQEGKDLTKAILSGEESLN